MGTAANSAIYYTIVGTEIILGLIMLSSAIAWGLGDQTKNIKVKKIAGITFLVSCFIFYVLRFGAISLFAGLRTGKHISIGVSMFKNILRVIQLMFISVVPTFFLIESYIFKYQHLIIDHPESKAQERKYLVLSIVLPVIITIALQLMISLL